MEEWLADPVQIRMAEDRRSRRASNANSRAASRKHSYMEPLSLHQGVPGSQLVVENNRFPLSDGIINLLSTQYLMNLDRGELAVVSQPDADTMDDTDDDGLYLLEDDESNDAITRQDRVFMNKISRSLKMVAAQQTKRHVESSVDVTLPIQLETVLPRSSFSSIPTTMLARVSLVPKNNPSTNIPPTTEKSKTLSKLSFWPSRSCAIANDSDPIVTFHESDDGLRSRSSNELTKQSSKSAIQKMTSAFGRMFTKSNIQ